MVDPHPKIPQGHPLSEPYNLLYLLQILRQDDDKDYITLEV